jgi:hypothetical protein
MKMLQLKYIEREEWYTEFNGVICFGGSGSVYGLHLIDGKQLWQFSKGSYVDDLFAG